MNPNPRYGFIYKGSSNSQEGTPKNGNGKIFSTSFFIYSLKHRYNLKTFEDFHLTPLIQKLPNGQKFSSLISHILVCLCGDNNDGALKAALATTTTQQLISTKDSKIIATKGTTNHQGLGVIKSGVNWSFLPDNYVGVHQVKAMPVMCTSERANDCANKKSGKKCKIVENNKVNFSKIILKENVKIDGEKNNFFLYGLLSFLFFCSLNPKPLMFCFVLFIFSSFNPKPHLFSSPKLFSSFF
jgi:hypothetical protein